ncbi:hypothetical protein [Gloeocapsopsis dulcis]
MNARHTLDRLFPVVESLSVEEKVELVQHLLSNQPNLSIVIGNNPQQYIINQLGLLSSRELGEVLKAIALRIPAEGK